MEEEQKTNWNLASNSQLKGEIERLMTEFKQKQKEMEKHVNMIEELDKEMRNISSEYIEIEEILNKREGKTNIN